MIDCVLSQSLQPKSIFNYLVFNYLGWMPEPSSVNMKEQQI